MRGLAVLSVAFAACWFVGPVLWASEPRFLKYSGPPVPLYGLTVAAPWENGGTFMYNLPEHLEITYGGQGILRNTDEVPAGHWQAAEDGRSAVLDVESTTIPGTRVKGMAKVAGADRIELTIRVENGSTTVMPGLWPMYCFQYRQLTGFPQWQDNFKHTYVIIDGKVVALADVETQTADTRVKGAAVRGVPQPRNKFADRYGGVIEEGIDRAIIAVTSLDGRRKVVVAWTPGQAMLSNSRIPCMHADPYYGPLKPGESLEANGVVIFTEEPVEEVMLGLMKAGVGAPPATAGAVGAE